MLQSPIAIVSVGVVVPGANDLASLEALLWSGAGACAATMASSWGGVGETPVLDPAAVYRSDWERSDKIDRLAGVARYSIHQDAWPRPQARYADQDVLASRDPSCTLAVAAAIAAMPASWRARLDPRRISLHLAALALPTRHAAGWAAQVLLGGAAPRERSYRPEDRFAAASPANVVAQSLGVRGPVAALDAACASSIYTVAYACDALRARRCDAALAGGVGAADPLYLQMGFSQLGALSRSGFCRPLDARADGLLVGEGACLLGLRRLEDALADGEDILAVIRGAGLSNDRAGKMLAPSQEGQLRAMKAAYRDLDLTPAAVGHVECHATGTPTGDAVEVRSIAEFFASDVATTPANRRTLGATKASIGHLLTAAGAVGITAAVLAVRSETRPPVAGLEELSSSLRAALEVVTAGQEARPWSRIAGQEAYGRVAAVNAFGFGGTNAHLLVQSTQAAVASLPRAAAVSLAGSATPRPVAFAPASFASVAEREAAGPASYGGEVAVRSDAAGPIRIAITGIGIRLGGCDDVLTNTHRLMGLVSEVPRHPDPSLGRADIAGRGDFVDEIRLPQGRYKIPPRELIRAQAQQVLLLEAARAASLDAEVGGVSGSPHDPPQRSDDRLAADRSAVAVALRTGCFLGLELEVATTDHHLRWQLEADHLGAVDLASRKDALGPALDADRVLGGLGSIVASRVARELGLGGPSHTVSCDEVSGLAALELAVLALRQDGTLDRALVGAGDLLEDPRTRAALDSLLDLRGGATDAAAGRIDARAEERPSAQLSLQDCACVWVLEREADAIAAGRRIYATLTGIALTHGGETGVVGTDHEALRDAVSAALAQAERDATEIDHVESTLIQRGARDRAEHRVLADLSRARRSAIAKRVEEQPEYGLADLRASLGSVALDLGYAGAATGMLAATRGLLCLYHSALPTGRGREALARSSSDAGRQSEASRRNSLSVVEASTGPRRPGLDATDAALAEFQSCLDYVLPARCQPWLTADPARGRSALVTATGLGGGAAAVVLTQARSGTPDAAARLLDPTSPAPMVRPAVPLVGVEADVLVFLGADDVAALAKPLDELERASHNAVSLGRFVEECTLSFDPSNRVCLALVLGVGGAATSVLTAARSLLAKEASGAALAGRVTLRIGALGSGGEPQVAFVFPGSGSQFVGMGAEILLRAPWILAEQAQRYGDLRVQQLGATIWNRGADQLAQDARTMIIAHVSLATLMSDLAIWLGITPRAALGYSLGESAGLFALGAWTQRATMLRRVACSPLFVDELAGENRAAARFWARQEQGIHVPPVQRAVEMPRAAQMQVPPAWLVGVIAAGRSEVECAIRAHALDRAYLLIVNTDDECVVGGLASQTRILIEALGRSFVELHGVTTVHCEVVDDVAASYRDLHLQPTQAPDGIRFYVGSQPQPLVPTPEAAADAILANARQGIDWPRTVRQAWDDGLRVFLEVGPGASCTRMNHKLDLGRTAKESRQSEGARAREEPIAVSMLPSSRSPWSSLLVALAACGVAGVKMNRPRLVNLMLGSILHGRDAASPGRRPSNARAQAGASMPSQTPDSAHVIVVSAGHRQRGGDPGLHLARLPATPSVSGGSRLHRDAMQTPSASPPELALESLERGVLDPAIGANEVAYDQDVAFRVELATRLSRSAYEAQVEWMRFAHEQTLAIETIIGTASYHAPPLMASEPLAAVDGESKPREPGSRLGAQETRSQAEVVVDGEVGRTHGLRSDSMTREQCLTYASRELSQALGPAFSDIDSYPTRVRLPAPPLMLVDRVDSIALGHDVLSSGRLATEHDVRAGAWYLDGGRICTSMAIESGQADLMLAGFLGIDRVTAGRAVYRLLDATVEFHSPLPGAGATIRYQIELERFFLQGGSRVAGSEGAEQPSEASTHLFRFHFDATVDGKPLMSMRDGCAGFFTHAQLDAGRGIVDSSRRLRPPALLDQRLESLAPVDLSSSTAVARSSVGALSEEEISAITRGELEAVWGEVYGLASPRQVVTLPAGPLRLIHGVESIDPQGGRFGIGRIVATTQIDPQAWFISCHFVDDPVMPGTLMYECCLQALRILLLRRGVLIDGARGDHFGPRVGVRSQLKCRGQVLKTSRECRWEIDVQTLAVDDDSQEIYAIADARMWVDGKAIVEVERMSVQAFGCPWDEQAARWAAARRGERYGDNSAELPSPKVWPWSAPVHAVDELARARLEAFADGSVALGLGAAFSRFDQGRFIARLPRPPFLFMDHAWIVSGDQDGPKAGASAVAVLRMDRALEAYGQVGQSSLPLCYLLEIALQPCGLLSAWTGSAFSSNEDLRFRNLGGEAFVLASPALPLVLDATDALRIFVTLTANSRSAGMLIQHYEYRVESALIGALYEGTTYFGFFSNEALGAQRGLSSVRVDELAPDPDRFGQELDLDAEAALAQLPTRAPFPSSRLRMVEDILAVSMVGGSNGLGFAAGAVDVDAQAWFFTAHFRDDPVWPGSLGLEGVVQLLAYWGEQRWGVLAAYELAACTRHSWVYRGQIVPGAQRVRIDLVIVAIDDHRRRVRADAVLRVDGKAIYELRDLEIECRVR